MTTEAEIEKEFDILLAEYSELIKLIKKTEDIIFFGAKYQSWYSRALKLVELLGADRLEEFISYYRIDSKRKSFDISTYVIQDYVQGYDAPDDVHGDPKWDIHNVVYIRITNQNNILMSLKGRLSSGPYTNIRVTSRKVASRLGGPSSVRSRGRWHQRMILSA